MSTTPNLDIEYLVASQSQKDVTVNEALDRLDGALGSVFTHDMASDANYPVADADALTALKIKITDTGTNLTAGRNIILPDNRKFYLVENATGAGFTLTFKTSGGSGVSVADGSVAFVYCDGTNIVTVGTSQTLVRNSQTGTTYTLKDSDRGKVVSLSNASDIAVTVPQAGSGGQFADGWYCYLEVPATSTGTAVFTPTTSTISGAAKMVAPPGTFVTLMSDGTNYSIDKASKNQSGQGGFCSDGINGWVNANSSAAFVSGNNVVHAISFSLEQSYNIGHLTARVTAGQASALGGFGYYTLNKNKIMSFDSLDMSGTNVGVSAASTQGNILLLPGPYWFAQSCSNAAVTVLSLSATGFLQVYNAVTTRMGTAANAMVSGVLPAALGAISSLATTKAIVSAEY